MKRNVDIITMGCSKNLVDSEHLIYQLSNIGFNAYCNSEELHNDIAIVNTCGFIESAKEESINAILELCNAKEEGKLKEVYVMGCLSQRYREQLEKEIPQVDRYFGKFDWKKLIGYLAGNVPVCANTEKRILTTPRHYAYIKISEGCDRKCAYCAIPIITGPQQSRKIEDIVSEVTELAANGTHEFQIIAQDSTAYGTDLYHQRKLPTLIERLADIKGVEWLRIHYAYPNDFPYDLLRVIKERDNVCKYLDIALQHASDSVLKRMRRNITGKETRELINHIRKEIPQIALRTTFMVGFPGETEEDFEELLQFTKDMRFERMGAFAYSEEDGTYAANHYTDDVSAEVKQERLDRLMELQQSISEEICSSKIGKTCKVIIDRKENEYYIARTEHDSPEVDGEVLICSPEHKLEIGKFYNAKIVSSNEYDLIAEIDSECL
jgi:ribosomal protein S12 methylthiotransferase